ncbi:phosphotransferase enzyme family protein [Spirosoma endophyticum]|uniref:Ser/Thr protein kinase RdoA involved in Cpx stress response, MazF antagonist n=1 Tax=Spirosoma endophyticum TaxID=662367 RepID=A0A1I1RR83_9BACT|nr:phosphotransferase [Spirosoma endophyticum]SFD34073.1 Ser/Thr protein kinase RdoA involved in Cpx stress response, MazF antagonist [Spirosoma endophyticum]
MPPFPVSSSILSTTHLTQFLQEKYKLSPDATCRLLKAGVNHSYLVTNGAAKSIFRIYSLNWRSKKEIEEELRLLNQVNEGGIPVSYPLADVAGTYIQELQAPEGKRFGVLFSFAEGEKLLTYSEELHYKMGTIMARFHQLTQNLTLERVTYTPQIMLVDSLEYLKPFLPSESEEMQFMHNTQRFLLDELAKIESQEIRQGLVHLDIWFDNLNIADNDKITLFDFDFCGNAMQCYDLGYYILQIHSTEADEKDYVAKRASFLAGYESVSKISDEEMRLLPMLGLCVYFFYLGVQCQRFDDWSNVFVNELYLKRFITLRVKRWADFNKMQIK